MHIDRQLPFLCVYRKTEQGTDLQFERLIMGEASYLIAGGNRLQQKQLSRLVRQIALTMQKSFGSFLIVEVWKEPDQQIPLAVHPLQPVFRIVESGRSSISSTIQTLMIALNEISIRRHTSEIFVESASKISPPGLSPLLLRREAAQMNCHMIGISVRPVYRNSESGQVFPLVRRELQRGFARALKRSFFAYTYEHTPFRPLHYHSLGRWSMVKAVWEADRQLAEICNGFDFLLQVTPSNSNHAWSVFQRNHYEKIPEFEYRPLTLDPTLAKRKLYQIPIERIEDPTLAQLFREQQLELDRKFTMVIDRNTNRFMYGSMQLYGTVEDELMELSLGLMEKLPARSREESAGRTVDAQRFATRAREELAYFEKALPKHHSKVFLREDITGLMVSQGNLLISSSSKIPESRIEALIQHEVGTHVLTYLNGRAQPFRQLYIGLAGYEELQEGLAVLSEYLVGGFTRPRLRLLAARVIAARYMLNGASFIEVFQMLSTAYHFARRTAFTITMRTFRCGGLTKDIVYLRGLAQLLDYLGNGGALESLYVGKISVDHVAMISELQWRKILKPAPLKPRFINDPAVRRKLEDLRNGFTPIDLIERSR